VWTDRESAGKLAPAPDQDTLKAAGHDEGTWFPQLRIVEAFDDDFRPTG
jgi:hypothetical protein